MSSSCSRQAARSPTFGGPRFSWRQSRCGSPGVALLWCSVLAVRVPHLREAVRAAYQQLLARRGLLAGAAAIPAVALAGLVASRPDRTVGSMVADPLVQSLAAVAGVLLLVSANRERLLMRLDASIYPETADQRQALADAAAALGKAERIETVSRTLSRTAERGCGSPVALLLPADAAAADLNAPDGKVAPLAAATPSRTSRTTPRSAPRAADASGRTP